MSIELGSAYISILPATSKLVPEIKRELGLVELLASNSGERSGRKFGAKFGTTASRFAKRGLFAATTGVSLLGAAGLKTSADLEQSRIAFETMLGSAERADTFLAQIKATAIKTPFELKGLTESSKRLLAFGFDADSVIPTLTTLGDAAAGLGKGTEGLNQLVTAVGQIRAKGKLQGDEMLQLMEAGIPAQQILRNQLGLTATEFERMQRAGLLTAF